MYETETSFFKHNIQYHIVESPTYEQGHCHFENDCPNQDNIHNTVQNNCHKNESLVLAFHSSLLCFKIALCVLL